MGDRETTSGPRKILVHLVCLQFWYPTVQVWLNKGRGKGNWSRGLTWVIPWLSLSILKMWNHCKTLFGMSWMSVVTHSLSENRIPRGRSITKLVILTEYQGIIWIFLGVKTRYPCLGYLPCPLSGMIQKKVARVMESPPL